MGRGTMCVVGAAMLLVLGPRGLADVITFGTQATDRLDLAGVKTEGAFRYQATGSAWELSDNAFGNPPVCLATLYNGEIPAIGDYVDIKAVNNGLFVFNSIDYRTPNNDNSTDIRLRGYVGGASGLVSGSLTISWTSPTFQTIASGFPAPIDLLRIEVIGSIDGNAMLLDNVTLTLPEPATMCLLAPLALLRRRTRI